jgi:cell wall-associated NlpC family hydrolase
MPAEERSAYVERSPTGLHSGSRAAAKGGRRRLRLPSGRLAAAASLAAAVGLAMQGTVAGATPRLPSPNLKTLLARAAVLSNQIDLLSQQYDALKIQFDEAKAQLKVARETVQRDQALLARDQTSIGQIAAAGYMAGDISPTMQLLESSNPQAILNRASILAELQRENGDKINLVVSARLDAQRAKAQAILEAQHAAKLAAAMQGKVAKIQARENILNGAAFAQAMAIFQKTGTYPITNIPGDSVGVQALRKALTRIGSPYVWGAAGPNAFDCSGLVVWAYAQIGISLPHFTGWLWNSGIHVSRSQLEPGDLIFFFADLGHVGIYIGGNEMIDAPTWGIPVGIHAIFWGAYEGGVRIP